MTPTHAEIATARRALHTALLAAANILHTAGCDLLDAMQDAPKAVTLEDWAAIAAADDLHFRLVDLSEQDNLAANIVQFQLEH